MNQTDEAFKALADDLGSSVVAELLRTVWERGTLTDLDTFVAWARENVCAATLWESRLGPIVDELEDSFSLVQS